ncbi:Right handed beta helix region [Actinacidiphila alni]|uniref:Right handed beta helix region n=1 Tax=Actinacidiphila alni TaxID=380248 RepID=A0A1I2LKQ6_9ACTN|nr:right-handed parallel beta-helix repeat-containing protein [Actinacidiphila alni]SFF78017.1 Right handed beta helix region [Actinacidiphila alni]SFF80052.1 Right handed beta helix region [Actinacidiphila alni]
MRAKALVLAAVPVVAGLLPVTAGTAQAAPAAAATYYVSPSGSDSNTGLSAGQAWRTITKVNSTVFGQGSTVSFEGGQSFSGCLVFNSTNVPVSSASVPFTVTSYGTGRATVSSACTGDYSSAVTADNVSGFRLDNVKVVNGSTTAAGVLLENQDGTSAAQGLTVSDSDISGFGTPAGSSSSFGGQIMVLGYAVNGHSGPLDSVVIRDNALHGAGVTSAAGPGVYGWGSGANITNVTVEGNTVYNLGMSAKGTGAGITGDGWDGAVIQHNVVHDVGANVTSCGGASGIETYTSNNVTVRYNEVYNVQPSPAFTAGCDWDGIDLDGGTTNSVAEYNYTHHNAGSGLLAYTSTAGSRVWGPNTFRYNISENDDWGKIQGGLMDVVPSAPKNALNVYGNTFFTNVAQSGKSSGSACFDFGYAAGTWGAGSLIADNICSMGNKDQYGRPGPFYYNAYGQTGMTLSHNLYYTAGSPSWRWGGTTYSTFAAWQAAGVETSPVWGDPLFASAGAGGTCSWTPPAGTGPQPCPQAYTLKSGSPAAGSGVAVAGNGGTDYYRAAVPAAPNIGADAA